MTMNVGPFEVNDLLLAQAALQSQADDMVHIRVCDCQNVRDLLSRIDGRQSLVITRHRWDDFGIDPGKTKKAGRADVLVGECPIRRSAFADCGMKIEEVLTADFVNEGFLWWRVEIPK